MEDGTTVLFGLPGVAVDRVEAAENGVRTVHLVTADRDTAACPVCGVFSASVRQQRTTRPKDLPYADRQQYGPAPTSPGRPRPSSSWTRPVVTRHQAARRTGPAGPAAPPATEPVADLYGTV